MRGGGLLPTSDFRTVDDAGSDAPKLEPELRGPKP